MFDLKNFYMVDKDYDILKVFPQVTITLNPYFTYF